MSVLKPLIEKINKEINQGLPGIKAHRLMLPEGRSMPDDYWKLLKDYKQSAVMLLLYEEQNHINILLTERHQYAGNHSGQISLPGGKRDAQDLSLLDTAYRETYEEIGILSSEINLITAMTPLYIPVSNFSVQPFLGYLEKIPQLNINQHEVKEILSVPIDHLSKPSTKKICTVHPYSGSPLKVPSYNFQNKIIWGATAMVISEFENLIFRT